MYPTKIFDDFEIFYMHLTLWEWLKKGGKFHFLGGVSQIEIFHVYAVGPPWGPST